MGILDDSIVEDSDRQIIAWHLNKIYEQHVSFVALEDITGESKVVVNVSDKNYPIGTIAICNKHSKYVGWLDVNY